MKVKDLSIHLKKILEITRIHCYLTVSEKRRCGAYPCGVPTLY